MPNSLRTPLSAVLAFACGLCLAGGIATAAAKSSGSAKACATKKDALSLLRHGKCGKGSHKVTLGAKGARGAPGLPGAPGAPGAAATKYWAVVSESGTLEQGSSGVSAKELIDTSGGRHNPYYLVTFPQTVDECAPEATPYITTIDTLPIGELVVYPEHAVDPTDTTDIDVSFHADGAVDTVTAVAAFSLTVSC